jgi:hypothetical protein
VAVAQRLEAPGTGVGDVDADPEQQFADLSRVAQIGVAGAG